MLYFFYAEGNYSPAQEFPLCHGKTKFLVDIIYVSNVNSHHTLHFYSLILHGKSLILILHLCRVSQILSFNRHSHQEQRLFTFIVFCHLIGLQHHTLEDLSLRVPLFI
jgi:hypothetical protein